MKLAPVHLIVGLSEQFTHRYADISAIRRAGRQTDRNPLRLQLGCFHRRIYLGHRRLNHFRRSPVHQHGNLIAANPRNQVGFCETAPNQFGGPHQQIVALLVTERIIDQFEPVKIEDDQTDPHFAHFIAPQHFFFKICPIVQPGQHIVITQVIHLFFDVLSLGDITRRDHIDGFSPQMDQRSGALDLDNAAAFMTELAGFHRQFMLKWQDFFIIPVNLFLVAKNKFINRHFSQFCLRIADQLLEMPIGFNDHPCFRINQDNRFGRFLHQRPVALLTLFQGSLGLPVLFDHLSLFGIAQGQPGKLGGNQMQRLTNLFEALP